MEATAKTKASLTERTEPTEKDVDRINRMNMIFCFFVPPAAGKKQKKSAA
jgi:hypothetical protein